MRQLLFVVILLIVLPQCGAVEENELSQVSRRCNSFERCKNIKIKQLHIDDKVCIVIQYLSAELGIDVNITWGGKTVFNTKISAKKPPALCFKLPITKAIKACLQLTDVSFKPHHHGACLSLTLKALTFKKTFKLGCIYKTPRRTDNILRKDWYEARLDGTSKIKTGYEDSDWAEVTGSGSDQVETPRPRDTRRTSDNHVASPSGKCVCPKPRKCVCCNNILKNTTKVCGRILVSKKGKGFWLDLIVNNNKNFRVYAPVARRFSMVCGDSQVTKTSASICLQLDKVQQVSKQLKGCITAHVILKTSHLHQDLGCFTLRHHKADKQDNKLLRFVSQIRNSIINFL